MLVSLVCYRYQRRSTHFNSKIVLLHVFLIFFISKSWWQTISEKIFNIQFWNKKICLSLQSMKITIPLMYVNVHIFYTNMLHVYIFLLKTFIECSSMRYRIFIVLSCSIFFFCFGISFANFSMVAPKIISAIHLNDE